LLNVVFNKEGLIIKLITLDNNSYNSDIFNLYIIIKARGGKYKGSSLNNDDDNLFKP
jgi:hypothetical protein